MEARDFYDKLLIPHNGLVGRIFTLALLAFVKCSFSFYFESTSNKYKNIKKNYTFFL